MHGVGGHGGNLDHPLLLYGVIIMQYKNSKNVVSRLTSLYVHIWSVTFLATNGIVQKSYQSFMKKLAILCGKYQILWWNFVLKSCYLKNYLAYIGGCCSPFIWAVSIIISLIGKFSNVFIKSLTSSIIYWDINA